MTDLKDKVVLVTGSSSGIGEGIVLHLAKLGCKLTITGRDNERLQNVAKQCISAGLDDSKILSVVGDMSSDEHQENLIKKTVEKFGHLDVLVNNAALLFMGSPSTTTKQAYDEIMSVNLRSVFFLTQLAIPHLKETKELGPSGVRANIISPGSVHSLIARRGNIPFPEGITYDMAMESVQKKIPIGRIGNPDDIAKAVAFLASNEQSSYLTGDNMYVDGGFRFSRGDVARSDK